MIHKSFFHYGQTYYHLQYNSDKFASLYNPQNSAISALRRFIVDTVLDSGVPNEFFNETAQRSHKMPPTNADKIPQPTRYKAIIDDALKNRGKYERHYVVQKYLVESPNTNFVLSELPLWAETGATTGHVDLVELGLFNPPYIWLWDYKPNSSRTESINASGQLGMYRVLLAQHLGIDDRLIGIGQFDEVEESIFW